MVPNMSKTATEATGGLGPPVVGVGDRVLGMHAIPRCDYPTITTDFIVIIKRNRSEA